MGVYSFSCAKCGDIDLKLKPSQIPLKKCPICGCDNINRIFQPINSIWKVDGAYSKPNNSKE